MSGKSQVEEDEKICFAQIWILVFLAAFTRPISQSNIVVHFCSHFACLEFIYINWYQGPVCKNISGIIVAMLY